MAQKVWFTNDPVVMLNIDVEGDGKQVITRPATEQDKANYGPQLAQMQQGGGNTAGQATPGVAGQPGGAAQNSGQSGTTTRETQPAQPNQQQGAVGGQNQPSAGQPQ